MLQGLDVEPAVGDLEDLASLKEAMPGCDVVFHAAAYYALHSLDMSGSLRVAVEQMRRVLQAARESDVSRLVYTSSVTTIGHPGERGRLADERDFYVPGSTHSAYYESKWAMEAEAWGAAAEGLPVIILNPTTVFGPWDVKPVTGQILVMAAKRQVPFWLDREQNVVDARDVGMGHVLAAERGQIGERYILGSENVTVRELLTTIADEVGRGPPKWKAPLAAVSALVNVAELLGHLPLVEPLPLEHFKTLRDWQALNAGKAKDKLGFKPRPLADTVRDTLAWFREYGYL
jgi:dihydroflavonol-4-reductase